MSRSTRRRGLVIEMGPRSAVSEAYRSLRTNIAFACRDAGLKTVMIASALPGEGKSVTAAQVAASYAHAGRQVLLLDANLRSPVQHKLLELSDRDGLVALLNGEAGLDDGIQETGIDNLHAISAGSVPPNPSELLDSAAMSALLTAAKERFDIVIVDSPAILSAADARIVASKCDGVVLVVRADRTAGKTVDQARRSLAHGKANVIGAVLNHIGRLGR